MGDISKHFSRSEFACKCGCGFDAVDAKLLRDLEQVREALYDPHTEEDYWIRINSGCRCPEYNESIGGSKKSQHLYGRAADFVVADTDPRDVYEFCEDVIEPGGLGNYETFTHMDSRTGHARWEG